MDPSGSSTPDQDVDLIAKVGLLMRVPLFSSIGPSDLLVLAASSKVETYHSGEIIFRQHDLARETYIIISGEAEVISEGPEGKIAVATVGQHQFIGEIAILVDAPRTATVMASTNLVTLVISKEDFYRIATEDPIIGVQIMRELARRLVNTTERLRQARSDTETTLASETDEPNFLELLG